MNKLIECVARAICREHGYDPDAVFEGRPNWHAWERFARVAIDAMKSPTDAMLAAGSDAFKSPWDVWAAMIHAALTAE